MSTRISETSPAGAIPNDFRYTPLQHLRELYIAFAQGLFYAAPLGSYHWAPGDEETEIFVSNENPVQSSRIGSRPAITFTRGPVQFSSICMDDMMAYDFHTGTKTKSVIIPGTMSINCISRRDIESDNIAWTLTEHIWMLREMLMQSGFFEVGRSPVISAPSPAGSLVQGDNADGWYVTTISSPFQFIRTSNITPINMYVLNQIRATLRMGVSTMVGQGIVSAGDRPDLPYQITTSFPEGSSAVSETVHKEPHPLNPNKLVTIRAVTPFNPGPSRHLQQSALPIRQEEVRKSTVAVDTVVRI